MEPLFLHPENEDNFCLTGLLWQLNETMHVKGSWKLQKTVGLWDVRRYTTAWSTVLRSSVSQLGPVYDLFRHSSLILLLSGIFQKSYGPQPLNEKDMKAFLLQRVNLGEHRVSSIPFSCLWNRFCTTQRAKSLLQKGEFRADLEWLKILLEYTFLFYRMSKNISNCSNNLIRKRHAFFKSRSWDFWHIGFLTWES